MRDVIGYSWAKDIQEDSIELADKEENDVLSPVVFYLEQVRDDTEKLIFVLSIFRDVLKFPLDRIVPFPLLLGASWAILFFVTELIIDKSFRKEIVNDYTRMRQKKSCKLQNNCLKSPYKACTSSQNP